MSHLQQQNPDTVVLLVGILPVAVETSPDDQGIFEWPNLFSPAIGHVNQALETFASEHSLVHYIDCADDMLINGEVRFPALAVSC